MMISTSIRLRTRAGAQGSRTADPPAMSYVSALLLLTTAPAVAAERERVNPTVVAALEKGDARGALRAKRSARLWAATYGATLQRAVDAVVFEASLQGLVVWGSEAEALVPQAPTQLDVC